MTDDNAAMRATPEYRQGRVDGLIGISRALAEVAVIADRHDISAAEAINSVRVGVDMSISLIEAGIA